MSVILVVEDEVATQIMLGFMLQRSNYTVVTVKNGQEALTHLDKEAVDLIIADVNMPEMGGLEMLQKLRANERYKNLPIIMFTAVGTEQIEKDVKRMGANGFLRKPVSSREIASVVEYYLNTP